MSETKFEGTDVCMCMHTALRKYCDSNITSAAYNLIHLICDSSVKPKHSPWRLLGRLTANRLNASVAPIPAVMAAVDNLDDAYFDHVVTPRRKKGKGWPKGARQWLYALQCTLQCFDESDWEGLVALLERNDA